MTSNTPTLEQLIQNLELQPHIEGGYFKETYRPVDGSKVNTQQGQRHILTCIYYLLTADKPVGHFHRNLSPIVHFYHMGEPIDYFLIYPDGRLEHQILGPNVCEGQNLQIVVEAGVWKASRLHHGSSGYGLIGESVSPGFEYQDMQLADQAALIQSYPQHVQLIKNLTR
jgi:predicted cupin superfamily sugar epimerase